MRAAVCHSFGSALAIEDVVLDPPGRGQVQVRLAACAICHSDVHFGDGAWGGALPAIYGHEAAGDVTAVGADVTSIGVGSQVVVTLVRSCGRCTPCVDQIPVMCDGGFEEDGDVDLLFGTHGQFTPSGALRLAACIESADPLWFEEPTPPEMPEEMAKVARGTRISIATGDRLVTQYEFARVLDTGAASILQMNLGRVGGLLEAKKIAGMAETRYAQIASHLYCGPVVGAANVQRAMCSPNFLILEGIEEWGGFHAEILKTPMRWEDGHVIPPDAPGLGVELDEAVADAHPYTDTSLHLEMSTL